MKRRYVLAADVVLLACIPIGWFVSSWMLAAIPDCVFYRYGILCPSCGGTRCVQALLRGDVAAALSLNAYVVLTAVLLIVMLAVWHVTAFSKGRVGGKLFGALFTYKTAIVWAIGWVVFGILRNIIG